MWGHVQPFVSLKLMFIIGHYWFIRNTCSPRTEKWNFNSKDDNSDTIYPPCVNLKGFEHLNFSYVHCVQ